MRASPLSAIFSHPHPTVTLTGEATVSVLHESFTSRPMGRADSPAFAGAPTALHVQMRPESSFTVRCVIDPPLSHIGLLYLSQREVYGRTAGAA